MKTLTLALVVLVFLVSVPVVMAHAPLGTGDNESIDKATVIPDPTKSWALYASLNSDGDAQYYTFNLSSGQKLHVMMYKSVKPEDSSFTPRLVIMGEDIPAQGDIPSKITIPTGYSAMLVNQTEPQPTFEPFSPSTFIGLADETLDNPAAGKYYLVVYEESDTPKGGNYGLAIGDRETYTISEWILIPFNLIKIYQWEGQSLALVLTPMVVTLIFGVVFIVWQLRKRCDLANPMAWLGAVAGFAFVGTGISTLSQLVFCATKVAVGGEAAITLIFAVIPLVLGFAAIWLAIRDSQKATLRKRIIFVILGVIALFMWAGLIVGPILAILAALMPTSLKEKEAV